MPTNRKRELLKTIEKERPKTRGKMINNVVVIEQKKINDTLGMLRFEYYVNDEMEAAGSFAFPLIESNDPSDRWQKITPGQSEYFAVSVDIKAKSFSKLLGDFFRRSLQEGKIQDILPFGKLG